MNRVLIVTDSYPYPARNGIELPLIHVIDLFKKRGFKVALCLLWFSDKKLQEESFRYQINPHIVDEFVTVKATFRGKLRMLWDETITRSASFCNYSVDLDELEKIPDFDYLWASPVAGVTICRLLKETGKRRATFILGSNDAIYYSYREKAIAIMKNGSKFRVSDFLKGLRSFPIARCEAKYLRLFDFVHVQTSLESNRLRQLIGSRTTAPEIIQAQNGTDTSLFKNSYSTNSKEILYMNHLSGERRLQSLDFLKNVWLKVNKEKPYLKLVIIGKPPPQEFLKEISKFVNVEYGGFASDLNDAYAGKLISIIPHYQTSGVINRLFDSMAAGVPTVVSPSIALTAPQLVNGKHFISPSENSQLAQVILDSVDRVELLEHISESARAELVNKYSWMTFSKIISDSIFNVKKDLIL